jgi:hypothetical protein
MMCSGLILLYLSRLIPSEDLLGMFHNRERNDYRDGSQPQP